MNIRDDLMPISLFTINLLADPEERLTLGIDLTIPSKIRATKDIKFSAPFMAAGLLSTSLTKQKGRAVEGVLGCGAIHSDPVTKGFYKMYNLPSWLRVAAIIAIDTPNHSCEVRPVTSQQRVNLTLAIAEAKEKKANNIGVLVSKLRQMKVQDEAALHPFVTPIYPSRVPGEKIIDRRIFAVGVGWDSDRAEWKKKTSFEVISDLKGQCNNFLVHVSYEVDRLGNPTSSVVLEPRWKEVK